MTVQAMCWLLVRCDAPGCKGPDGRAQWRQDIYASTEDRARSLAQRQGWTLHADGRTTCRTCTERSPRGSR